MFNYVNVNTSLRNYSEEMIDILLELYNKIKDKFQFINKNTEVLVIDNTLENVDLMLDSLNKLADMLEMNSLFEDEYYLAISIITDIEYIINKKLLKENLIYVGNIVINFCKLIYDKQDWILSNKNFNYENEYEEFLIFYNNQKEMFLSNIPKPSEKNKELIKEITNILW